MASQATLTGTTLAPQLGPHIPTTQQDLQPVDLLILLLLLAGSQETSALAKALGKDRGLIYRRCRRLEQRLGLLDSRLDRSRRTAHFLTKAGDWVTVHPKARRWALTEDGRLSAESQPVH